MPARFGSLPIPPAPARQRGTRHVHEFARGSFCTIGGPTDRSRFLTHFDHIGDTARLESAKLIARHIANCPYPAVLLGDFNSKEDGPVYAELLEAARSAGRPLVDAYRVAHPTQQPNKATYHGFVDVTDGQRIDWILHDAGFDTVSSRIGPSQSADGTFASDHSPLWATLRYSE